MYSTHYIVLACTHSKRIKKYEPRILSEYNGDKLGNHLSRVLGPNDYMTVISGYRHNKVKQNFKSFANVLKYDNFETCGMNNAISWAIKNTDHVKSHSVCIMHSDIYFQNFDYNMSENFILYSDKIKDSEVGIQNNHGIVEKFSYAETPKWAKVINFDQETFAILKKVLEELDHRALIDTEIYNIILNSGVFFNAVQVHGLFKEFDNKNDYIDS